MPKGYWRAPEIQSKHDWQQCLLKARSGDVEMQYVVGSAYEDGLVNNNGEIIVRKNSKHALSWFLRGAHNGHADCQNNLAGYYSAGLYVKRDLKEALLWFRRAYRKGDDTCAPLNIALVYSEQGNNRRAFFWFSRASKNNNGDATVHVASCLLSGNGVRKNPQQGVRLLRKAIRSKYISEYGRQDAMYHLGRAYLNGNGVPKSIRLAKQWLLRADQDGDHQLAYDLLQRL